MTQFEDGTDRDGQTRTVLVTFRRLSVDGLHAVRIERDDGVVLAIESRNRKGWVPHDMGHFVGEQAFGIEDGFWGSVAAGARFRSVRVVQGKLRHDAVEHGHDLETASKHLVRAWGSIRTTPMPYDRATLASAIDAFAAARDAWAAVPVGGELPMVWTVSKRRSR